MNEKTDMDSSPLLTGIDMDMHPIFPSTDNKSVEHVYINSALGNSSNLLTVPIVIYKTSNTKNLISQNLDNDEGPIEKQQQPIEQQPLERPIEQQPFKQPIDAKGRFSPFEFYTINLVRQRESILYLESRNRCKFYMFRKDFAFFRCT